MNRKELDDARAKGGAILHIPLAITAGVPVYNLDGMEAPLNFTGPLLADIYLGKLTKWNDQAVKRLNPGVTLPDLVIQPVFRADSNGTSALFIEYLSKVSPEFKQVVGKAAAFPQGVGVGKPMGGVGEYVAAPPLRGAWPDARVGFFQIVRPEHAGEHPVYAPGRDRRVRAERADREAPDRPARRAR